MRIAGEEAGFDYGGDNLRLLTAAQGRRRYLFDFPKAKFVQSIMERKPLPRVQLGEPVWNRYRRRKRFWRWISGDVARCETVYDSAPTQNGLKQLLLLYICYFADSLSLASNKFNDLSQLKL